MMQPDIMRDRDGLFTGLGDKLDPDRDGKLAPAGFGDLEWGLFDVWFNVSAIVKLWQGCECNGNRAQHGGQWYGGVDRAPASRLWRPQYLQATNRPPGHSVEAQSLAPLS